MSFVSPSKQQLILDLLMGRVSLQQFCADYPTSEDAAAREGLEMLKRAVHDKDGVAVEFGLYLGHKFGITPDYLEPLNALAAAAWHQRHEDVVAGLAKLRHPTSVDALFEAARFHAGYLDYDDTFALARRAIHALAVIPSVRAVQRLGQLLSDGRGAVEEQARKSLTRIANAGTTDELRSAASHELSSA